MARSRNGYIDLWRFIASIIIVLFHYGDGGSLPFPSGALFVEFFFMLSSYYALKYINQYIYTDTSRTGPVSPESVPCEKLISGYMKKQYVKMLPYLFVCVCLFYGYRDWSQWHGIKECIKKALFIPLETLLLRNTGVTISDAGVLWYLSTLFICLPVVMWLAVKCKQVFFRYLVWWGPFFVQGYVLSKFGTFRVAYSVYGIIRAFGALLLGGCVFELAEKLKTCRLTALAKRLLLAVELGLMLSALYMMRMPSVKKTIYEEVIVLMMAGSLVISLSEQTVTSRIKGAFFGYLAKLSLPIYCFHMPLFSALETAAHDEAYYTHDVNIIKGFVVTLAVSVVVTALSDHVLPRATKKLKRLLVLNEKDCTETPM